MDKENVHKYKYKRIKFANARGNGFVWFLGFIGALVYYVHVHSGTFWLVILAILKAFVWPAILIYHLLLFLKV
ncbi:MAG TPA: hypothetical protein VMR08_01035 [Patescibacteria group bacterium]|jgi:hypothetical protein|nr:hypothetical protein [Patescibacteria group bacterium]